MKHMLHAAVGFLLGTAMPTCEYIVVLLALLGCNSAYGNAQGKYIVHCLDQGTLIAAALLLCLLLMKHKGGREAIWESCPLLLAELTFGVFFLYINAGRTGAAYSYTQAFLLFLPVMTAVFKAYHCTGEPFRLLYVLSNVMFLLASLSLAAWLMGPVLGLLQPSGDVVLEWGDMRYAKNYFNICICWQAERLPVLGQWVMRNTGIFTEAPMYNIPLNTALFTELFLRRGTRWGKCLLLTLAVCSTVGTLGILLCAAGWAARLFPVPKGPKVRILRYAYLTLAVLLGAALLQQKWDMGNNSFGTHIDDYIASLKAWKHHPFIGCGYENSAFIEGFMGSFRAGNPGLSNSVAVVLAQGGVLLSAFYLLPFLVLAVSGIKACKKGVTLWAAGVYGIFCTAIFHYRYYMLILLALGYSFWEIHYPGPGGIRFSCAGGWELPREEKNGCRLLYALAAMPSACILVMACSNKAWRFAKGLFAEYQLGLEESQWNAVILVIVLVLFGNMAKYLTETIGKNKGKARA